jgi:hypothetical protein
MTNGGVIVRNLGLVLIAGVGLGACSDLSMNERVFVRGPDGFQAKQSACYSLEVGTSSGSGGGNGDFEISSMASDGVLSVRVESGDKPPVTRRYDRDFARSGVIDEFTFTTVGGQQFLFRYWGSDPCENGHLDTPP